MNENAKKWVEALRSGEYKQGKSCLRDKEDRFCCLGVACDLYDPNGWSDHPKPQEPYKVFAGGATAYLPVEVVDWLGLHAISGAWKSDQSLAGMNDRGASFEEIANMIESEPEGMFR